MRRSKLELYEDIICTLASKAFTLDGLAFECNLNCITLQQHMDFLINNDIVSIEISRDDKAFYVLTRRGAAISKTLAVTKRLEKLQTQPETEDETIQAIAALSERIKEKAKSSY